MEGTADNLSLLLGRELVEVNRISGYAYGKVGVKLGVVHCINELLTLKNVYVDVVSVLCEVATEYGNEVAASLVAVLAECRGNYREGVGNTVAAVITRIMCPA